MLTSKKKRAYEAVLIGKQIRYYRRIKEMSQKQLAAKVGVSVGWIGRIERGIHLPNIKRNLAKTSFSYTFPIHWTKIPPGSMHGRGESQVKRTPSLNSHFHPTGADQSDNGGVDGVTTIRQNLGHLCL